MSPVLTVIIAIITLIAGFILLIKGADAFVSGSSAIAKKLRVPPIVIGLTVVAMGTSFPELAVSLTASMSGSNSLAVSNVTGSNLFNLLVVLGMSALFAPLAVGRNTLRSDFPFSIVCAFLLAVFGYTSKTPKDPSKGVIGMVGRLEGAVLLVLFVLFLVSTVVVALKARKQEEKTTEAQGETGKEMPVWRCILYIVLGAVAIKFGGDFVVGDILTLPNGIEVQYGATAIARIVGMSETLIGLTIVAMGTSLPELVTSIVAARKNEVDMAVGNVIGSNIFNILLILGTAAAISPIDFIMENLIDIAVLIASSLLVWIFAWTKGRITRAEGCIMLSIYAGYMVYICLR
ncbi:MAG: calcium/sodium antiporter [Lachnospiraceae bacterium]|nr:calcium/sodium antiporter [Lachnospiraceae bacterium]